MSRPTGLLDLGEHASSKPRTEDELAEEVESILDQAGRDKKGAARRLAVLLYDVTHSRGDVSFGS